MDNLDKGTLYLSTIASLTTIASSNGPVRAASASVLVASLAALVIKSFWHERRSRRIDYSFDPHAPYKVYPATEDDIRWASDIASELYTGLDIIPKGLMLEWYSASPTGFFILKDRNGHRCGNLDVLPLKPTALARILEGDMIEREVRGECLFRPEEREEVRALYVESLVAVRRGDNGSKYKGNPHAAYEFITRMLDMVLRMCNPLKLERIYAIAASDGGIGVMRTLGFDKIESKRRRDGHELYSVTFTDLCRNIAKLARDNDRVALTNLLKMLGEDPTL